MVRARRDEIGCGQRPPVDASASHNRTATAPTQTAAGIPDGLAPCWELVVETLPRSLERTRILRDAVSIAVRGCHPRVGDILIVAADTERRDGERVSADERGAGHVARPERVVRLVAALDCGGVINPARGIRTAVNGSSPVRAAVDLLPMPNHVRVDVLDA